MVRKYRMIKDPGMMGISTAVKFAQTAHAGQKYGNEPYTRHLQDVYELAFAYDLPTEVLTAAWLHDTLEDTETTIGELVRKFGTMVATLVDAVTDVPGENRRERIARSLPRTRRFGEWAVALKLCDRIANVRASSRNNPGLFKMYSREHEFFKTTLYREGEHEELWKELDKLISRGGR